MMIRKFFQNLISALPINLFSTKAAPTGAAGSIDFFAKRLNTNSAYSYITLSGNQMQKTNVVGQFNIGNTTNLFTVAGTSTDYSDLVHDGNRFILPSKTVGGDIITFGLNSNDTSQNIATSKSPGDSLLAPVGNGYTFFFTDNGSTTGISLFNGNILQTTFGGFFYILNRPGYRVAFTYRYQDSNDHTGCKIFLFGGAGPQGPVDSYAVFDTTTFSIQYFTFGQAGGTILNYRAAKYGVHGNFDRYTGTPYIVAMPTQIDTNGQLSSGLLINPIDGSFTTISTGFRSDDLTGAPTTNKVTHVSPTRFNDLLLVSKSDGTTCTLMVYNRFTNKLTALNPGSATLNSEVFFFINATANLTYSSSVLLGATFWDSIDETMVLFGKTSSANNKYFLF